MGKLIVALITLLAAAPCVAAEYEAIDLGTLGGTESDALAINDLGQVVVGAFTAAGEYHVVLWTAGGGMQDLGTLGGFSGCAEAINDLGQVVGLSQTATGEWHACMWRPVTPETMLAESRTFILVEMAVGGIDAELEVSLLAKVDAAAAALARGNANDAEVAMNDLKALVNQVQAQADKKITAEVAAEIVQRANQIIAALGG